MWLCAVSGEGCQMCELSGWVNGEDGAVERGGSLWVSPEALTPGGFDAIFPRRESTWEELVNNICPSSERLTSSPTPFTSTHTHTHTALCCQSHYLTQVPPLRTGLPKLDRPPYRPLRAQIKRVSWIYSKWVQSESVIGAKAFTHRWMYGIGIALIHSCITFRLHS